MTINKSNDILIDSSSLFKVFRDNLCSKFVEWIKQENKRLILTELIISEMIGNKNEDKVINDFKILGNLLNELGNQHFAWMKVPEECLEMEMKNKIFTLPLESDITIQKFRTIMSDIHQLKDAIKGLDPNEKDGAKNWKEKLYIQLDLNAQNKIALNPSSNPEIYYSYIINYNGPVVDSYFLEDQLNRLNSIKGTKITTSQIIKRPSRFSFLYTWICFTELTALGNLLPRKNNDEIAVNLRSSAKDKGNWFDNIIATSATLCGMLLTEDKKFIWKCNYLHSKKLIHFTAKKICEILK